MRIFSKKPYVFHGLGGDRHDVTPLRVEPVPDWVAKTELFQLAVAAGNIEAIPDKKEQVAVPAKEDAELLKLRALALELGIKNAYKMGKARLRKEIAAKKEVMQYGDGQHDAGGTGEPVPDGDAAAAESAGG